MHYFNKKKLKEWLESFLLAIIIACVLFFICWPLQIDGNSMENSLRDSDRVLMSRVWTMLAPPSRGDIAVCEINDNGVKDIIKRVIALPGDHIVISNGSIYINGWELKEEYVKEGSVTKGEVDLVLGTDEYFVMGDYREVSKDSRNMGAIKADKIVGKIIFRFFPFDKIKGF